MANIEICVYGADVVCASCVNLPSAKDTFEWLQSALTRRFPNESINIRYIDINVPQSEEQKQIMCEKILNDEHFYPLVTVEDEVVDEGNPSLKKIITSLESYGYQQG
ncbi:YuzD family protein [Bacillus carboniphilus]|uniref:YuzD family protein n=1 Tax=Bacillus carboniphilus TaxID=86663 RepID=A0ABY9JUD5_9BACI|nr:YuzD family protein [Bacillus carboniphilus]WLR41296.1 YuzD family protein [Bacillus carboniphilus]